ncbi:MAG: sulfatase family protein [Victivallaceae bacterium]
MNKAPNILMIMTDQHHAGCFGYKNHPDVKTPNIDTLAAAGVTFNNCFCQNGVCVPSRVTYMTGQYCHTHGVYGNDLDTIPEHLISLPQLLQSYGYETAMIGKKHMPNWKNHGFQYERLCYHADAPVRNLHYYNYLKKHNLHALYDDLGDIEKFCLTDGPKVPLEHSLEVWTANEAIEYLRNKPSGKPFFMQMSFERPHPPLTVPDGCPFIYDPHKITLPENSEELPLNSTFYFNRNVELKWCKSMHGEETLREALCAYYSLISLIDYEIGRVLSQLEKSGIRENTLIVLCADHGDFAGEYGKMAKGWNYDAIHRVPYIWNWPGKISGRSIEALVETVDFFPTICALLEIPVPKTVQGSDLSAVMSGKAGKIKDEIFYEFIGVKTIRTENYKLSYGYDGEKEIGELFDLKNDPHEYDNLFDKKEHSGTREKLLRKIVNWLISTEQPGNFSPLYEKLPGTRWFNEHPLN